MLCVCRSWRRCHGVMTLCSCVVWSYFWVGKGWNHHDQGFFSHLPSRGEILHAGIDPMVELFFSKRSLVDERAVGRHVGRFHGTNFTERLERGIGSNKILQLKHLSFFGWQLDSHGGD